MTRWHRKAATTLGLAAMILFLAAAPTHADIIIRWYFGVNTAGMSQGFNKWYDSDGSTLLTTGAGVQLICAWPDNAIDPPSFSCQPTGDDYFVYLKGGPAMGELDSFGSWMSGAADGVTDGVVNQPKRGSFTNSATCDNEIWENKYVFIRAWNATTCMYSTAYGDSLNTLINPANFEVLVPGSLYRWSFVMNYQRSTVNNNGCELGCGDTPTPTPTATPTATGTGCATCISVSSTPTFTVTSSPTPTTTPTITPVPPTPYVSSVAMPNKSKFAAVRDTRVDITWASVVGLQYRVEACDDSDVVTPEWVMLQSNIPGNPGSTSWTDNSVGAIGTRKSRFYRVVEQASGQISPNVAGFYMIETCPGASFRLAGMPIAPYGSSIQDVVGWQLTGNIALKNADCIDTWKCGAYVNNMLIDVAPVDAYNNAADGMWYCQKTGTVSTDTISHGEGFWVTTRQAGTQYIYVEGEVPDVAFAAGMPAGAGSQALLGLPYPRSMWLNASGVGQDNLGYAASGGTPGPDSSQADSLYTRACGASYAIHFLAPDGSWWDDGAGRSSAQLAPGQGFWIKRGTSAGPGFTWTIPKPY